MEARIRGRKLYELLRPMVAILPLHKLSVRRVRLSTTPDGWLAAEGAFAGHGIRVRRACRAEGVQAGEALIDLRALVKVAQTYPGFTLRLVRGRGTSIRGAVLGVEVEGTGGVRVELADFFGRDTDDIDQRDWTEGVHEQARTEDRVLAVSAKDLLRQLRVVSRTMSEDPSWPAIGGATLEALVSAAGTVPVSRVGLFGTDGHRLSLAQDVERAWAVVSDSPGPQIENIRGGWSGSWIWPGAPNEPPFATAARTQDIIPGPAVKFLVATLPVCPNALVEVHVQPWNPWRFQEQVSTEVRRTDEAGNETVSTQTVTKTAFRAAPPRGTIWLFRDDNTETLLQVASVSEDPPDFEKVVPKTPKQVFTVSRRDIQRAARAALVLRNPVRAQCLHVNVESDALVFSRVHAYGADSDVGASARVPIETAEGVAIKPFKTGFRPAYLLEAANALVKADRITIYCDDEYAPWTFVGDAEGFGAMILIMPMRV